MVGSAFTRNKVIFYSVSFFLWFSHFVYLPILSPYIEFLGGKYVYIGLVLSSYGFMQFVCRLPIGIVSDLLKRRKPFIIFGMCTSAASCFLFALTEHLGLVLLARALAGVAAATWVVFTVLFSSYFTDSRVHEAMSSISFIVVLAQLLGMIISGFLVDSLGWHAPFWIGGLLSLLGATLALLIYEPNVKAGAPVQLGDLSSVIREPLLLKVSFLSIIAHSIIFTTMFGFLPTYATRIGLNTQELSFIVFAFMIPHAIGTLFLGNVIVPRLGKWNALNVAFLGTVVFTLLTPMIDTKVPLMVVQGFNGFFLGILFPLLLGMSIESIAREKRATAMGVYQALYAVGMFTGPFLAGILSASLGLAVGFYFCAGLALLASILVFVWKRNEEGQSIERFDVSG